MTGGLPERGLRSAAELANGRRHGDRLRYLAGCRCSECRRANTAHESMRARARRDGDWNGIVDAAPARSHLLKLRRAGVGRRSVAYVSDVGDTIIQEIVSGRRKRIRGRTERRILAVSTHCMADGALVDARKPWRQIRQLLHEGFTKVRIAEAIGQQRALQLSKNKITLKHAVAIDRLWRKYMTEAGR